MERRNFFKALVAAASATALVRSSEVRDEDDDVDVWAPTREVQTRLLKIDEQGDMIPAGCPIINQGANDGEILVLRSSDGVIYYKGGMQ